MEELQNLYKLQEIELQLEKLQQTQNPCRLLQSLKNCRLKRSGQRKAAQSKVRFCRTLQTAKKAGTQPAKERGGTKSRTQRTL